MKLLEFPLGPYCLSERSSRGIALPNGHSLSMSKCNHSNIEFYLSIELVFLLCTSSTHFS